MRSTQRSLTRHRSVCGPLAAGSNTALASAFRKCSAILDFGGATDTGTLSVPDLLGGSPATQATAARKPTIGTSANGLPIATFTDDFLSHPLSAANNGSVLWGYAVWLSPANVTGTKNLITILSTSGGASANKLHSFLSGAALRTNEAVVDRNAIAGTFDTSWQFATVEVDCSQATEAAKVIVSRNGAAQTVSFSGGTTWPSSMATPTGNALIGALTTVPANPFVGRLGPKLFFLKAQLTSAERTALMNWQVPSD